MRVLAHREPTLAQHVHVGVHDQAGAVRALDGLRSALPLLLAVSANSPFWRGGDSGFASIRTPIFGMFPRTGIQRRFGHYAEYVRTVDQLLRTGVIPDRGCLWWDARLQPRLGTVEVRIMDAQSRVSDVGRARRPRPVPRPSLRGRSRPLCRRARAARGEPLPRRPRRHGCRAGRHAHASGLRPARDLLAELVTACGPSRRNSAARPSWRPSPRSRPIPAYARQRRFAAEHGPRARCLSGSRMSSPARTPSRSHDRAGPRRPQPRLPLLLAMAMFVLVVDTSLMNVSISAVVRGSRHDRQRRPVGDRARGAGLGRVHPDRQQDRRPVRPQAGLRARPARLRGRRARDGARAEPDRDHRLLGDHRRARRVAAAAGDAVADPRQLRGRGAEEGVRAGRRRGGDRRRGRAAARRLHHHLPVVARRVPARGRRDRGRAVRASSSSATCRTPEPASVDVGRRGPVGRRHGRHRARASWCGRRAASRSAR